MGGSSPYNETWLKGEKVNAGVAKYEATMDYKKTIEAASIEADAARDVANTNADLKAKDIAATLTMHEGTLAQRKYETRVQENIEMKRIAVEGIQAQAMMKNADANTIKAEGYRDKANSKVEIAKLKYGGNDNDEQNNYQNIPASDFFYGHA